MNSECYALIKAKTKHCFKKKDEDKAPVISAEANTSDLAVGLPQSLFILWTILGRVWGPVCCLSYRLLQKVRPISDAKIVHKLSISIHRTLFYQGGSVGTLVWIHSNTKHLTPTKKEQGALFYFSQASSTSKGSFDLLHLSECHSFTFFFGLINASLPAHDLFWSPPLFLGFGSH